MEPISPELVLVDPELARVVRAQLVSSGELEKIRRVVEEATFLPQPPQERRFHVPVKRVQERLTVALLGLSVAANGALAAAVLTGDGAQKGLFQAADAQQNVSAPRQPVTTDGVAATTVERVRGRPQPAVPASRNVLTKSEVERRILNLMFFSPKTTLPPQLIDASTGLPKNNLQVVCSQERTRIFRCDVHAAFDERNRVVVRYRVLLTGRGLYSWSRAGTR